MFFLYMRVYDDYPRNGLSCFVEGSPSDINTDARCGKSPFTRPDLGGPNLNWSNHQVQLNWEVPKPCNSIRNPRKLYGQTLR